MLKKEPQSKQLTEQLVNQRDSLPAKEDSEREEGELSQSSTHTGKDHT